MDALPAAIFKSWVHSHEEDTEDVIVYRPSNYAFPPARGRRGFEFREGGQFIDYGIAPANGTLESVGRWHVERPGLVRIDLESNHTRSFTLDIISCDGETLKIRR
jgi:hypothetical protein